jgi:hypothetical protein
MAFMASHAYSIAQHKRSDVVKWLAFVAAICAAPLTQLLENTFAHLSVSFPVLALMPLPVQFAVSAGLIYLVLYWVFNNLGWLLVGRWLKLPNLSGKWDVVGKTLDAQGNVRFDWSGELSIRQKWDGIEIHQRTPNKSESESYVALIVPTERGEASLAYGYRNTPDVAQTELQRHDGFCELTFSADLKTASGRYFTSRERQSFGSMELRKKG